MALREHREKLNKTNPIRHAPREWQVAPREHEFANYDEPKIRYRRYVEEYVQSIPDKTLKKRSFYTISTNVLCADIATKDENLDPIDRDIYLPLEIAITRWCLNDGLKKIEERQLDTKVWMLDPGRPTSRSISIASDHSKKHKIELNSENRAFHEFIDSCPIRVLKMINGFLPADRTVFSLDLRRIRQDLGSLKWLNQQGGCRSSPIKVYHLEDLYVVLLRRLSPEVGTSIGQGIAHYRMDNQSNPYESNNHCKYHKKRADEGEHCNCCARNLSQGWPNVLIDDCMAIVDANKEEEDRKNQPSTSLKPAGPWQVPRRS